LSPGDGSLARFFAQTRQKLRNGAAPDASQRERQEIEDRGLDIETGKRMLSKGTPPFSIPGPVGVALAEAPPTLRSDNDPGPRDRGEQAHREARFPDQTVS